MYGFQNNYQYYPQQRPQQTFYKGRPVQSEEEVRNTIIDMDGQVNVFPDLSHQCIYTKHIDMGGMPVVQKYVLETKASAPAWYDELKAEIKAIKKHMGGMNNEPDAAL